MRIAVFCAKQTVPWPSCERVNGWDTGSACAQVSRLFSALLQLANNGNVALLRGAAPADPFRLRLLRLARPSLAGFRAPSCLQARCWNVRVSIGSIWVTWQGCFQLHAYMTGAAQAGRLPLFLLPSYAHAL